MDQPEKFPWHLSVLFSEKIKDFKEFLLSDATTKGKIAELKDKVETFARGFNIPGLEER